MKKIEDRLVVLKEDLTIMEGLLEGFDFDKHAWADEILDKFKLDKGNGSDSAVKLESKINDITGLLDNIVIGEHGSPNTTGISALRNRFNIFVSPGEQDSFGWVTAIVTTPIGKFLL